jgi:hypothetical protein
MIDSYGQTAYDIASKEAYRDYIRHSTNFGIDKKANE